MEPGAVKNIQRACKGNWELLENIGVGHLIWLSNPLTIAQISSGAEGNTESEKKEKGVFLGGKQFKIAVDSLLRLS